MPVLALELVNGDAILVCGTHTPMTFDHIRQFVGFLAILQFPVTLTF